jgi:hypothetical protein
MTTDPTTLPEHQSRPLGRLTIAAVQRLAGDTLMVDANNQLRTLRMARALGVVLIDHPADDAEPRCISCYFTDLETLDTGEKDVNGVKFRFDPERLLYALRWKHNATPPDVELVLVRERNPAAWIEYVVTMLFGALNGHDPQLFDPALAKQAG